MFAASASRGRHTTHCPTTHAMEDQQYKQQFAEYEKNKDKPHFGCKGSGTVPCCGKEKCRACHGKGVQKCLPCHGTGKQYPNLKRPDPPGSAPQAAYQPPQAPAAPLPKVIITQILLSYLFLLFLSFIFFFFFLLLFFSPEYDLLLREEEVAYDSSLTNPLLCVKI